MSVTLWWGRSKKKGMGGTWVVGKKKGKKKEKRKKKEKKCGTWVVGKKRKEKIKKKGGGGGEGRGEEYTTGQRVSEEENEKGRYFGSCEKNK